MFEAGTIHPSGKGYSQEFSAWVAKNRLYDMDKSDRAKLFTVHRGVARDVDPHGAAAP